MHRREPTAPPPTPTAAACHELLATALTQGLVRHAELRRRCRKRIAPKALHALRIETRRLLALIALAGAVRGRSANKLRRRLKRILRLTADLRDLHEQVRVLAEWEPQHPECGLLVRELKRRARHEARAAGDEVRRPKLTPRLERVARKLLAPADSFEAEEAAVRVLRAAIDGLGRAGSRAARSSGPAVLHRLRLAVKKVRYLAEPLESLLPAGTAGWIEQLHRQQRRLGELHDLDLLLKRLARYERTRALRGGQLQAVRVALARRRQRLLRGCRLRCPPPVPGALRSGRER